jgi:CP family cyanate transporter-like MFS transporter
VADGAGRLHALPVLSAPRTAAAPGVRTPAPLPVWLTLVGVLLVALNLRAAIAGLAPLLPDVRADLGLSRGTAGLLTTLPVLCFGLLSPFAVAAGRRLGTEAALLVAMLLVVAGSLVRTAPGLAAMIVGTAVVGAGITVGNVLVPSAVKQHFAHRQGLVTGLYTAALTGGAAIAAAAGAPLAHGAGLGWHGSLLVWGGLAALGAVVWLPQLRARHDMAPARHDARARADVRRSPVTWALALFMGMQAMTFYALLAWLPTMLQDRGVSERGSSVALALFNLLGIGSALVVPTLATRRADQRWLAWATCAAWAIGLLGWLVAPGGYLVWSVVAGLGQGAGISLALTLLVLRAATPETARELSGLVQSLGYLVGATGPFVLGALRDASDGWSVPLAALVVAVALMAAASCVGAADRQVGAAGRQVGAAGHQVG